MTTVATAPSLDALRGLFAGDDLTAGYPTVDLAVTICRLVQPVTATALKDAIYGDGWPVYLIPWREREAMARGYTQWAQSHLR